MRLVFAGTPEFARTALLALHNAGHEIALVLTQPDRPAGRGMKLQASAVKHYALEHGMPVCQPHSLRLDGKYPDEALAAQQAITHANAELMVVVAYGLLLPDWALHSVPRGCLNIHASLLPRWRGAAPIERAILANDTESGVCVMQMEQGLDTGPVLQRVATPINSDDNSATLTTRLQQLGCAALIDVLHALPAGTLRAEPQNAALATYARKMQKEEAQIDWTRSAADIHNQVRALFPRSPAWTLHDGKRLRLIRAAVGNDSCDTLPGTVIEVSAHSIKIACGSLVLEVFEVQMEGKPAMGIGSLLNGHPGFFKAGSRF